MTASVDLLKNELDYQIVVRGTQAEVLATDPSSVRSGDVVPLGVCTDTGAILTWVSGRWMPSAPLSFASKEALYAAVAANGGQSLGPSVSVAGVLWGWSEYGVYAKAGSPPYVGSAIPTATMARKGDLIQVDNPAVPLGRSILRCTGTIWAPPRGEPIAEKWRTPGAYIVSTVPGVTSLIEVYGASNGSQVIPDYMLPFGLVFEASGWVQAFNPAGVSGCILGIVLSGSVPTGAFTYNYPYSASVIPQQYGVGPSYNMRGRGIVDATSFRGADGTGGGGAIVSNVHGTFVPGSNRVWVMAKPSKIDDSIRLDGYSIVSEGNL